MKVYVLGGGLAGLSAAHVLSEGGIDVTVLEAEDEVGGLARSFSEDGFTLDLGPHRLHTHDESLLEHFMKLMGDSLEEKERVSRILLEGRFFDYPLRVGNAMFNMRPLTTARIVADYAWIKLKSMLRRPADGNFEDWVVNRFGSRLYEIYFKVYTEKTWGLPCMMLSADWAAQRISLMSLWDTVVKTLFRGGVEPRTYASRFYYPRSGGVGRLSEEYAKHILANGGRILTNSRVDGITVKDGRIIELRCAGNSFKVSAFDLVYSTIPITTLIKSVSPPVPKGVARASSKLRFRSIVFVHLKFKRPTVSSDHWIYVPELKYVENRLSESRNFNTGNASSGKTVVTAEITCQCGDTIWNAPAEELGRRVLEDMLAMDLVKRREYIGSSIHRIEHAYPIYDLDYKVNLHEVIEYLKTLSNLRFFGRQGLFRYNNMDHSVSMGLTAAKSVTGRNVDYLKVAAEQHWFG